MSHCRRLSREAVCFLSSEYTPDIRSSPGIEENLEMSKLVDITRVTSCSVDFGDGIKI